MTKPDDRAQDAHPEELPDDDALDGEELPDSFDEDEGTAGEDASGEEAEFAAAEEPVNGPAPTTERRGRESATSRGERRTSGRGTRGNRQPVVAPRVQTASDIAVHIDDRASAIFVIGVIAVFVLILLNAVVLGKGGLLTPIPSPTPFPSLVPGTQAPPPSASASASPSGSVAPAASGSPGASAPASAAPSGSASPSATGSAAPSATPVPSATPLPSPSQAPSPSG
jgi:hypothetical protein